MGETLEDGVGVGDVDEFTAALVWGCGLFRHV
jgi:hypothetical protein